MKQNCLVVILMGSPSDQPQVDQIAAMLDQLQVRHEARVSSAHKTPERLLEILKRYEQAPECKVYLTVAGRSDALSGMVAAQVASPVIACPPLSTAFGGADVISSLRMPSGVCPMVVLEPANAALAAAKILSLTDEGLLVRLRARQKEFRDKVNQADDDLRQVRFSEL